MKKLIVFCLLSLSACGATIPEQVLVSTNTQQVMYTNPTPNGGIISGYDTFVYVRRGYYSGCRGHIISSVYRYPYGLVYVVSPL